MRADTDVLDLFHEPVKSWFNGAFAGPTRPQELGWPVIQRGESTLILAPTGSGKTLTAFLAAIDRVLFDPVPHQKERCRILLRLAAQGACSRCREEPSGAD